MADIKTAEIYSQKEGSEKRSVSLALRDDGSIQMHTYDDSQAALKIWGKEDYEFWVTVPPDAVPKLAFELLQARFAGCLSKIARSDHASVSEIFILTSDLEPSNKDWARA
jgi:hypothetical protein